MTETDIKVGNVYKGEVTTARVTRMTEHSIYYILPEFSMDQACGAEHFRRWVAKETTTLIGTAQY